MDFFSCHISLEKKVQGMIEKEDEQIYREEMEKESRRTVKKWEGRVAQCQEVWRSAR